MTNEQEAVTHEREAVAYECEAITNERGAIANECEIITYEREAVANERVGVTGGHRYEIIYSGYNKL